MVGPATPALGIVAVPQVNCEGNPAGPQSVPRPCPPARHGPSFLRQTTCDWARLCAELFLPLYDVARQVVLASPVVHTDDTSVRIRDAHKKAKHKGYFWVYYGDAAHPLVFFDYTPNHSRAGPAEVLKDFRGYVQADA